MRIKVDTRRCIGSGQCVRNAPGVFDQSDTEGTVIIVDANPPDSRHQDILRAARRCPAQAITIHDRGSDHAA